VIRRDRELLARLARVNGTVGQATIAMLQDMPSGDLPAAQLRALGTHLAELSADLLARAAEIDGRLVETPRRVVIDARN
jgi:hypothetical protein